MSENLLSENGSSPPTPPYFGAIPYAGNPMGNGYGRIAEYVYRDLTSNTYNPAAELNIANVLDYHSNGGYGGWTQWSEWNSQTSGNGAGKGWWWGYEAAPYDNLAAIACEFARPVVLAGVELAIKFGEPSTKTVNMTIYAWVDNAWVAVSDST